MNIGGFEIERKFLIAMPELTWMESLDGSDITQIYLLGERGTTERVRCRRRADRCEYTHTVKRRISDMRRQEDEEQIDAETYDRLLRRADPERRVIEKRRYCLEENGLLWEIDVFPFWQHQAVLEVELTEEAQQFTIPACFRIIREVTGDRRYTNAALSRAVPDEDMPEWNFERV